jgi:hypothetical protein
MPVLRNRTTVRNAKEPGPWAYRALLNPVTFLLDLLAVGRLVRSALLRHRRLLQAVENRGLEALQNVA